MALPKVINASLSLLGYLDLNKNELRNAVVQNLGTAPGSPVEGQLYYDSATHELYWRSNSGWVLATGSTTSYGSPTGLTVGGSNSDGVASTVSRSDHVHSLPGWGTVTAQTSFGAASGNGSATTFSRSDHTHGTPAAPTASSVGAVANAANSPSIHSDTFANRPAFGTTGRLFVDTTNSVIYRDTGAAWVQLYAFGSPSTQAIGDSASDGTAVTVARSDHKHAMPAFGNVTAQTSYGSSSGNGAATSVARSDHTHGTPALSSNVASTQAIGDTATNGSGTAPAKDDHKHAMPAFGAVTAQTAFGAASGNGAATSIARSDHTHGTPTHDASAHSTIPISSFAAATGSVAMGSQKITGLADGTVATDAATWGQVQNLVSGLDWKQSVRVVVTTNGAIGTAYANGQSAGGVTLATGDRILLAGQTTASENGIYTVNASGAPTRATDADANNEISVGTVVPVEAGTGANTFYYCTATGANPWVPGSSTSTWSFLFTVTGTQAGAGLTATGNVLAVGAGTGIVVNADDVAVNRTGTNNAHVPLLFTTATHSSATSVAITHNLGIQWVKTAVYDVATGDLIECGVTCTSTTVTTFYFSTAPSANSLRFVIHG